MIGTEPILLPHFKQTGIQFVVLSQNFITWPESASVAERIVVRHRQATSSKLWDNAASEWEDVARHKDDEGCGRVET
jgi:hypothetical protein